MRMVSHIFLVPVLTLEVIHLTVQFFWMLILNSLVLCFYENGMITINPGDWNAVFLDELYQFPDPLTHDDTVDALAYIDQLAEVSYFFYFSIFHSSSKRKLFKKPYYIFGFLTGAGLFLIHTKFLYGLYTFNPSNKSFATLLYNFVYAVPLCPINPSSLRSKSCCVSPTI